MGHFLSEHLISRGPEMRVTLGWGKRESIYVNLEGKSIVRISFSTQRQTFLVLDQK